MHAQTDTAEKGNGLWATVADFARHPAAGLSALRAVLPRTPGFHFAESMHGTATLNGQRRPMVFQVVVESADAGDYLRTGRTHLSGHVTISGLADEAPLSGELWIKLFQRSIRYEFSFRDTNGRLLHFRGQKDLSLLHPLRTLRSLPGEIRDEHGQPVAEAKLRFRNRDLPSFLRSFGLQ